MIDVALKYGYDRFYQMSFVLVLAVSSISFLINDLKLFSENIWIRRIVIVLFMNASAIFIPVWFGVLKFKWSTVIRDVVITTIVYMLTMYICDKVEMRRLEAINKKLEENIKNNDTENK